MRKGLFVRATLTSPYVWNQICVICLRGLKFNLALLSWLIIQFIKVLFTSEDPEHPHETDGAAHHNYGEEDYDDVLEQVKV